jgi:tetratricopeptide (TPR) repeat protein
LLRPTRFRVNEPAWFKLLPQPDKAEYASVEEPPPQPIGQAAQVTQVQPLMDRDQAIQALREKRYEPAIDFFKRELGDRPNYHSGWSRLGYAQREYAAFLMDSGRDEDAKAQLKDSLTSYGKAVQHSDPRYSAEARYHRSKAYWRLWKLTQAPNDLKGSLDDAATAAKTYYEDRFVSWSEYLDEEGKASGA